MKLRNKKTGEIVEAESCNSTNGTIGLFYAEKYYTVDRKDCFETLAELNEEWEDYKPKEPLIKNEALRKIVREWTREGKIEEVVYDKYWRGFRCENSTITIWEDLPLEDGKTYTIEELCGNEEGR